MNNRCRSAKLRAGAMTRMSNKLVYHFLRFNEPPAGVNRRGATLTRFLSSTRCIYGRGSPLTQNTPSRARFDSASHPFQVSIVDGFSRRVYALPLVVLAALADVFGSGGGKYTTCSVPVAPVVMSCPPCNTCNRPKMFWLLWVQTAEGC